MALPHVYTDAKEMERFKAWLVGRGAVLEPATSSWEILRVRTDMGLHVVYRNKSGAQSWPEDAVRLHVAWKKNLQMPLSPDRAGRRKVRGFAIILAERDGMACWFCAKPFESEDDPGITIEHLVPIAHGGPNHTSNLVLACEPCNHEAGTRSVSEKVRLREARRQAA